MSHQQFYETVQREQEFNEERNRVLEDMQREEMIDVCQYCGNERGWRFSCCGEVHFVTISRKAWEDGEEIK